MKLFLVSPNLPANEDREAVDARLRACVAPIADLIASHVGHDPGLYGMWQEEEACRPPVEAEASFGAARVARLRSGEALRAVLAACGNPFEGQWLLIRSLVSCRAVRYGHDGQAFVCLTTADPPIISPDETMITVETCSHLLTETDWMDGLLHD